MAQEEGRSNLERLMHKAWERKARCKWLERKLTSLLGQLAGEMTLEGALAKARQEGAGKLVDEAQKTLEEEKRLRQVMVAKETRRARRQVVSWRGRKRSREVEEAENAWAEDWLKASDRESKRVEASEGGQSAGLAFPDTAVCEAEVRGEAVEFASLQSGRLLWVRARSDGSSETDPRLCSPLHQRGVGEEPEQWVLSTLWPGFWLRE